MTASVLARNPFMMARWALLLLVLLSFGLIGYGLCGRARLTFSKSVWGSFVPDNEGSLTYVSISRDSLDASQPLFNPHPLAEPTDAPQTLSDFSPGEGRVLNGPQGLPRDSWREMVGRPVTWNGRLEEGALTFEETNRMTSALGGSGTVTHRRLVARVEGERGLVALSPTYEVYAGDQIPEFVKLNADTEKEMGRWQESQRISGRLFPLHDYEHNAPLPRDLYSPLGLSSDEGAWVIETEGVGVPSGVEAQGYYVYQRIEGSEAYAQTPLAERDVEPGIFDDSPSSIYGVWVPPGYHGFQPIDPRTKERLPGSFALLVTGSRETTLLLNRQWQQERSWLVFVVGSSLLGVVSLVLLAGVIMGWKVQPAIPDSIKPYAAHLTKESPPWWVITRSFGVVCILTGVVGMLASPMGSEAIERGQFMVLTFAMAFLGAPLGWLLLSFGAQLCQRNLAAAMRRKDRPPILYLRSFAADSRWLEQPIDLLWIIMFPGRFETSERALTKSLNGAGPLIAIGRPGELLPPMGAARLYVKHDKWQEVVAHLSKISGLVLLRVGSTDSFWWEVDHVLESCPPEKVIFMLPRGNEFRTYDILARHLAPRLKQFFPQPTTDMKFVGFRDDWSPVLLGDRQVTLRSRFRKLLIGSTAPMVRDMLLPALRHAGYKVGRLPLQFREWLLVLLFVGFLTFIMGMIGWFIHLDSLRNRAEILPGPPSTITSRNLSCSSAYPRK